MNQISTDRKNEILDIVDTIYCEYNLSIPIVLEELAQKEHIYFGYRYHKNNFDGILSYWDNDFYIIINTKYDRNYNDGRIRFTFAHELGHYFIDEHRNELMDNSLYHISKSEYTNMDSLIEKEADFFAANLLMPETQFKNNCNEVFSPTLIKKLSLKFQTSIVATVIRYIELDIYPMFVVYIHDGVITSFRYSHDFPYNYKNLKGQAPPKESIARQLSTNEYTSKKPQEIFTELWFNYKKSSEYIDDVVSQESNLLEYCYRINASLVITLIWEET